ncbi:DUF624 domain-containing protein [Microlunatus elymi]|uniref:DUF624 domain-containing protein n=1 Tax=Microlunatus elymi TaxID=2596828 RepID=A0A516Q2B8_9ACTN|nr:DUF624 domain-containing protein [Microlunatus elymi]QDP97566.1 DUF624 domain-containing protein [Microlunatus elymi]
MTEHWTTKAQAAADTVAWMIKLSIWWWLLTAIGLGVFGAAPASATGAIAVRRRSRGERVRFRDAVGIYRSEFVSANLALTPALLIMLLLLLNLQWFAGVPQLTPRLLTLAALALMALAACYLPALYAFYDLRRHRYLLQAIRIVFARPLWSVLMILVSAAVVFGTYKIIILAPIAVGVWLHTSSWLGLRFFTENEARRAAATEQVDHVGGRTRGNDDVFALPTEPLRTH